jgi:multiple sugar transport system ATP-binding protein
MTMATRIAVINKGELQQLDSPQNLYDKPNNLFVAGFIGSPAMNFFPAKLKKDQGKLFVETESFTVKIPDERAAGYMQHEGKQIIFGIRPEDIHNPEFLPPNIHAEKVASKVDVIELMGNEVVLYLLSGKNTYVARVDPRSRYRVNDQSQMAFNMDRIHIFDASTEQAIR